MSLIVLAAGKSSRMRGFNKLLLKLNQEPMVRKVVNVALNSEVDEVIVVLGWESEMVRSVQADLPCRFVVNKDHGKGRVAL